MNDAFLRFGPPGFCVALAIGCASTPMQVPTDLDATASRMGLEIMTAETYDGEGIQFGDFCVANITHLPTTTTVDNTSGKMEKRQHYTYELHHHGQKWLGECAARLDSKLDRSDGIYELKCRLRPIGSALGESWYLDVSGGTARESLAYGELQRLGEYVAIRSVHDKEPDSARSKKGFGFHTDSTTLGAVQTDDNQALWIRGGLDKDMESVVATGAAGLVLFEHLQRS